MCNPAEMAGRQALPYSSHFRRASISRQFADGGIIPRSTGRVSMKKTDLNTLLNKTTGASKDLDRAIAEELDLPLKEYSASVDICLELIHEQLPAAHWHVGRAADGVSMYATLSKGRHREECTRVTVPLALLTVAARFLMSRKSKARPED